MARFRSTSSSYSFVADVLACCISPITTMNTERQILHLEDANIDQHIPLLCKFSEANTSTVEDIARSSDPVNLLTE